MTVAKHVKRRTRPSGQGFGISKPLTRDRRRDRARIGRYDRTALSRRTFVGRPPNWHAIGAKASRLAATSHVCLNPGSNHRSDLFNHDFADFRGSLRDYV